MDNTQFLRGTEVASKKLQAFSQKATTFGANIARSLGVGFALAGTAAIKTAANYDRATATLGAITGKTTQGFKDLNNQSRELGRTTIFTATQIAEAQLEISKLGFSSERTQKIIKSSSDIAAVFGASVQDVGKTIASTLNQFGLDAEESGDVADLMAVAFRDSALDISKYREAMKNVGPTAKATGLSLKRTTAILAVLANNAVDGSLGGTKLRSALSDLAKKSPDAAAALKKLENGSLSYSEMLELLNKRAALVGQIIQDQGPAIEEMESKLDSATGTTKELADALKDSLFFNVERTKAATESLGISVGNALAPMMSELANAMESFAEAVENTDPSQIELIARSLLLIIKTGVLSLIAGQLAGLTNAMLTFANVTVPKFATQVAGLSGVLGGAAIAGGLAGAFVYLTVQVGNFFQKIDEMGDRVLEKAVKQAKSAQEELLKLANTLFDLLETSDKLRGGVLGETLGFGGLEDAEKGLNQDLFLRVAQLKAVKEAEEALAEARISGTTDELRAASTAAGFERRALERLDERIAKTREFIALIKKNLDLQEPEEELVTSMTGLGAKALKKVQDEWAKLMEQTRKYMREAVENSDFQRVFGANFMFDELSKADQVAALLNRNLTKTADEFKNTLESIELPEEEFPDFLPDEEDLEKLADVFIKIREGMEGVKNVAFGFAQVVGDAFLAAANGTQKFGEALKAGFLAAFKAIVAKLITLITLYTILAVVSGGMSVAAGGTFGGGVSQFTAGNPFGDFLGQGLGVGRSANVGGSGTRSLGMDVNVSGGLMGGDIAFASESGRSANDRRFG